MGRYAKPQFSENGTFVVSKPNFIFNGKPYKMGEIFDTKNVPRHTLVKLYGASKIKLAEIDVTAPPIAGEPQLEPVPPTTASPVQVQKNYVVKRGPSGLFYQYMGNKRVSRGVATREEAEALPPPTAEDAAAGEADAP